MKGSVTNQRGYRVLKTAIILAAGLGTRMRPLTEKIPKPLVSVGDKPLLQYCFDSLEDAGFEQAIVNVHYLPDQIIDYVAQVKQSFKICVSDEREELLDSGGGIVNALSQIDDFAHAPFLLLNADTFWLDDDDQDEKNIKQLADRFNVEEMDILLMIVPISRTTGHHGRGDFNVDENGRLTRFRGTTPESMIYAGAAIINPTIFDQISERKFSINQCFDEAIEKGRLYGHVMHGHWITVGTVDAISDAENSVKAFASD
ncbi:MAG: nucleotidyltransferase family protein [Lentilitoribacter sp.]